MASFHTFLLFLTIPFDVNSTPYIHLTPREIEESNQAVLEFKEMYKNVSSEIMPYNMSENSHNCMSDDPEEEIPIGMGSRSFTYLKPKQLWANGVVPWSFVSDGDEYARFAATTDVKVGLSKGDVETVEAAMKQIEAKTCIRFEKVKPVRGQPWLFIARDNKGSDLSCQKDYVIDELVGGNISGLGDIYERFKWGKNARICFGGAYAWRGSSSPQNLVISQTRLSKDNQWDIGLMVHEIIHNLGLGHTQKRQDASEHITIIKDNIQENFAYNYEPCKKPCYGYNDYNTVYDCMSIMHYRDYDFITDEARNTGGKTMLAKNEDECDLSSPNVILTNADINILNRMYCANNPAPVDGGWSDWSGFSSCSNQKDGEATCRKRKVRYCDNPPAQQGGAECIGDAEIFEDCEPASIDPSSNPDCVLYGGWTAWSDNSVCSESCTATRTRTCSNPRPFNYKECDGAAREISDCTGGDCPSSSAGIIRSPNYPDNYPHQQDLTIPIEVPSGSKIKLSFTTFDIENETSCNFDYVKVVDSDGITELAKLCGPNIPSPIISSGNKLLVIFHSDGSENRKGFEASWKIISSGEVSSPGYPSLYSDNLNVMKTIHVAEGSKIELSITALDIEEYEGSCPYDHLTVYDGETLNDAKLEALCGSTLPANPIVSTGNTMTLVFVTDSSETYTGYKGTWKQI